MIYQDSGYDPYFRRTLGEEIGGESENISISKFTADYVGFPADKLQGGQFRSNNGRVNFDLENGTISIASGGNDVVTLGFDPDTKTNGIIIRNTKGDILLKISEEENYILSPDGGLKLNFDLNRIEVIENGVIQALIGRLDGGS
ncbi:hypothetical protein M0R04_16485 [Candidatus Dojkabacteria bacterium]|jgi:hypothetical protein|nr:hypothetical protein [Candidatus Dojkabacteria bacterium]